MASASPQLPEFLIRPFQFRDLERIEQFVLTQFATEGEVDVDALEQQLQQIRRWYGLVKFLSILPNPLQHMFCTYVAEQGDRLQGMIQVSPFNRTRSTWRVDRVVSVAAALNSGEQLLPTDVGIQLLRYCFETIWEARTWLIEVNVNDKGLLSLFRQTGFQSLAQLTYWTISPEALVPLAEREPDLPNLLPVSNADAFLLHQLDTVSMPPLMRQVFDRQTIDFRTSLIGALVDHAKQWMTHTETTSGYVFEPQRKAAIGYFNLHRCRDSSRPHRAELTVHPAYTWLYPELLAQMARITQSGAPQSLLLASTDYQPEREEHLERIGAVRTEHTLLMSRSVWHKLRETRPTALERQLTEVLQGWQPARKPAPSRSWLDSLPFHLRQRRYDQTHSWHSGLFMQSSAHPPSPSTQPPWQLGASPDLRDRSDELPSDPSED